MMAAVLGKIEEFDRRKEDWDLYIERLEHFFVANAITEPERKRAVFLSVIGASTYKTLRSLLSPNKPGEQDYRELVQKLSEHYSPKPSEIVERTKFHSRFRKPGESVASFVAQLRSLSEHCNFGDNLEVMIRDRLVCGINDDTIQKRLLSRVETNLPESGGIGTKPGRTLTRTSSYWEGKADWEMATHKVRDKAP